MNFFGITDIDDLLDGPNKKPFPESWPYTVQWLGNQPNRAELAKAASPLTYVRAGVPPTISIHGDADNLVPYAHSVKLQEAMQKAGVAERAGHDHKRRARLRLLPAEWQQAFAAIEKFLATHVPAAKASTPSARH